MRKNFKKIIALALIVCMTFSTMTVLAENNASENVTYARLNVNGANYTVNDGATQSLYNYSQMHAIGDEITVVANGENFGYWMMNNKVMSTSPTWTFTLAGATSVTAVYYNYSEGTAYVEFVSENGQIMQAANYSATSEIPMPSGPVKTGYAFTGWDQDEAAIQAKIASGDTYIEVLPTYVKISSYYDLTVVYDGDETNAVTENKPGNVQYTVTAREIAGKKFAYWADAAEAGHVLSYNESYSVLLSTNKTVYAVYVDENSTVESESVINITKASAWADDAGQTYLSYEANRVVLDEYTVEGHGFLRATSATYGTEEQMQYANIGANIVNSPYTDAAKIGYITVNQPINSLDLVLYFRAYMILKDSSNNLIYVYSDIWEDSYNSLSAKQDANDEPEVGTSENPATAVLGTNVAKADADGYYYTYTSPAAGKLRLTMSGDNWSYSVDEKWVSGTSDDGLENYGDVTVEAGETITFWVNTSDATTADVTWTLEYYAPGTEQYPIMLQNADEPTVIPEVSIDKVYYECYFSGMILTIDDPDAVVWIGEESYPASEGITLVSENPRMPVAFAISNPSGTSKTFTMSFAYPLGNFANPAEAVLGENVANVEVDSWGYYYKYLVQEDGELEVTMKGSNWSYVVNNKTTGVYGETHTSSDESVVAEVIGVSAGDEIEIIINTYNPDDPWSTPAGNVEWTLEFFNYGDIF